MNLKRIRLLRNITQKQLADAIGVDHTIISKYEKGQLTPSDSRIEAIARVLDVNIDVLLCDEEINKIGVPVRRRARCVSLDEDKMVMSEEFLAKQLIVHVKGICELCGHEAPFKSANGYPYLESHFVKWLSKGGSTSIDNLVVLCPNCHKKLHVLNDIEDIKKLEVAASKHDLTEIVGIRMK